MEHIIHATDLVYTLYIPHMSCLFLDLNAKGIKTSGKNKRELKILCKHQENCEREMKVLGRRSKGIIASGLAGTRID
jgi:hypothetical protein